MLNIIKLVWIFSVFVAALWASDNDGSRDSLPEEPLSADFGTFPEGSMDPQTTAGSTAKKDATKNIQPKPRRQRFAQNAKQKSVSDGADADQTEKKLPKVESMPVAEVPQAEAASEVKSIETKLDEALKTLRTGKGFEANVERKITLAALDTERPAESGVLTVSGSKLRLEIDKPTKSLLVVNGTTVWLEVKPDADLGGETQVHRGQLHGSKDSQVFVGLLGGGSWRKFFKLTKSETNKDGIVYDLESKKEIPELKRAKVVMDSSNQNLRKIEYTDELGNRTAYTFLKLTLLKTLSGGKFDYKPPKGVSVMELN